MIVNCVLNAFALKAMLHEAIFLATCNATMTNKKSFKLQRGCYTQATCLAMLRKVEGHSTFLATTAITIAVAKWGVTHEIFLVTCNATFVALQVARKIASCNMALSVAKTNLDHLGLAFWVVAYGRINCTDFCKTVAEKTLQRYY